MTIEMGRSMPFLSPPGVPDHMNEGANPPPLTWQVDQQQLSEMGYVLQESQCGVNEHLRVAIADGPDFGHNTFKIPVGCAIDAEKLILSAAQEAGVTIDPQDLNENLYERLLAGEYNGRWYFGVRLNQVHDPNNIPFPIVGAGNTDLNFKVGDTTIRLSRETLEQLANDASVSFEELNNPSLLDQSPIEEEIIPTPALTPQDILENAERIPVPPSSTPSSRLEPIPPNPEADEEESVSLARILLYLGLATGAVFLASKVRRNLAKPSHTENTSLPKKRLKPSTLSQEMRNKIRRNMSNANQHGRGEIGIDHPERN